MEATEPTEVPAWYVEAKEAERAETLERQAKDKEEGTKAAQELGTTLRQFLPQSVDVDPHWYVQEYPQSYRGSNRGIAVWADLRLTEDVSVHIKPESGPRYRVTLAALKHEWAIVLSPATLLLQQLARIVDDVRKARAQQEEGERQAEKLRQRREREREEQKDYNARADRQRELAKARCQELGLPDETRYCLPEPAEESDEAYLARCEAAFEEPLRRKREAELQVSLAEEEAAAFKPITLYQLTWPRAVGEDGTVETGRAWSLYAEAGVDGFWTILEYGQLRRRKIVVTAGALEVSEHCIERFDQVPLQAKLSEVVERDGVTARVTRVHPCVLLRDR